MTGGARDLDDALRWTVHGTKLCADALAGLEEPEWHHPSRLPGWTRRHLVAHLAANADALGNLVRWAATGVETPMYSSPEQRAHDIESGAQRDAATLRGWFLSAAADLEDGRRVRGDNLVLATGTPILDRGLYFAKLEPQRSYALAFAHDEPPQQMLLSAGPPTRSVRDARSGSGPLLLTGGDGHTVGRARSPEAHLDALRAWTAE